MQLGIVAANASERPLARKVIGRTSATGGKADIQ